MDFGTYFKWITKIECMDLKNGKKMNIRREEKDKIQYKIRPNNYGSE